MVISSIQSEKIDKSCKKHNLLYFDEKFYQASFSDDWQNDFRVL
jgi:hypothetical protein